MLCGYCCENGFFLFYFALLLLYIGSMIFPLIQFEKWCIHVYICVTYVDDDGLYMRCYTSIMCVCVCVMLFSHHYEYTHLKHGVVGYIQLTNPSWWAYTYTAAPPSYHCVGYSKASPTPIPIGKINKCTNVFQNILQANGYDYVKNRNRHCLLYGIYLVNYKFNK